MKDAAEKGYIGGKLINPLTIKFNDVMYDRISAICDANGDEKAEWIRNLIMRELLIQEERFNRMSQVWGGTKETSANFGNRNEKSPVAVTTELNDHKSLGK
ncbi:hypothetical protein G9F31_00980 [Acinetobacter sp. 187]|uniref:hypothetical protein n=1 Tax=Acinetobacter lanii TaxID=2715163 RepID=UPI0014090DBD|nr:hypothetical protein [Acinetobacter lanii]NHC02358.1 hypothetical protein [Acinetobacter lanii]